MITIEPMTVDHLPDVVAIESASQPVPWSEQVFHDELAAPGRIYRVARNDRVVGFGGLMLVADEAHVTNLVVAKDHRRSGIGSRLMKNLTQAAVDAGARHLTLEVRTRNDAARCLYHSLGMAPVGVRPRYYGDDDALIMWAHDISSPESLEKPA